MKLTDDEIYDIIYNEPNPKKMWELIRKYKKSDIAFNFFHISNHKYFHHPVACLFEAIGTDLKDNSFLNTYPYYLRNLKTLSLVENQIKDLTFLSHLSELEELHLEYNNIVDVTLLSNLKNLKTLTLHNNHIEDIYPLLKLHNLKFVNLLENPIQDYAPIYELKNRGVHFYDG